MLKYNPCDNSKLNKTTNQDKFLDLYLYSMYLKKKNVNILPVDFDSIASI